MKELSWVGSDWIVLEQVILIVYPSRRFLFSICNMTGGKAFCAPGPVPMTTLPGKAHGSTTYYVILKKSLNVSVCQFLHLFLKNGSNNGNYLVEGL